MFSWRGPERPFLCGVVGNLEGCHRLWTNLLCQFKEALPCLSRLEPHSKPLQSQCFPCKREVSSASAWFTNSQAWCGANAVRRQGAGRKQRHLSGRGFSRQCTRGLEAAPPPSHQRLYASSKEFWVGTALCIEHPLFCTANRGIIMTLPTSEPY